VTIARSSLAYLLVALLAWTSVAAGVFAPNVTSPAAASTESSHQAASHASVSHGGKAHEHGQFQGTLTHHADAGGATAEPTSTSPENSCVASCLDVIAAKLTPLPYKAAAPDDGQTVTIIWPQHDVVAQANLPLVDHPHTATGPPDPVHLERSGAARLMRTNGRLRI